MQKKMPSGIYSVDLAAGGGLPFGSYVVLFGDAGSGMDVFMHTSAFMNAAMKRGVLPSPNAPDVSLPEKIWYLPLAKTKEDVIRDVRISFSEELAEAFIQEVQFREFMEDYYASALAPLLLPEGAAKEEETDIIEIVKEIVNFAEKEAKNSLIIFDSLDDLIRAFPQGEENKLLASLRVIQSRNKTNWNSLILNSLTRGIFPESVEGSILSLADGVFRFESSSSDRAARTFVCEKFAGVTSEDLLDSTFESHLTRSGLEARRVKLMET